MASKTNIRSIRFSDELYELIDRQEGDTFTQKLENLVTRCVWELPKKEQELKAIQECIETERKNLRWVQDSKSKLENNVRNLNYALESVTNHVKRCTAALQDIKEP